MNPAPAKPQFCAHCLLQTPRLTLRIFKMTQRRVWLCSDCWVDDPQVHLPGGLLIAPLLAIDPGNKRSAWVLWIGDAVANHGYADNPIVLDMLVNMTSDPLLVVEMIASYGMPVGAEVFETCLWIGRFVQAWTPRHHRLLYRREVKLHLCGSMRAKDANVRQALLDRFGGKAAAVGRKAAPGPLYGVHGDVWAALAIAVTASAALA